MTDDFVRKAFKDASRVADDNEFEAYRKRIIDNIEPLSVACGIAVVLDKMNELSGLIIKSGLGETFVEWTRMVMTIAFSEGYKAKAEEVD